MDNEVPKVLVTRKMPEAVNRKLKAHFTVSLNETDQLFSDSELRGALKEADGILCSVTEKFSQDILDVPDRRTQVLANFGVGVDHIDLSCCKSKGIIVTNTPDVLTDATADLAIFLILAATRKTSMSNNHLGMVYGRAFLLLRN